MDFQSSMLKSEFFVDLCKSILFTFPITGENFEKFTEKHFRISVKTADYLNNQYNNLKNLQIDYIFIPLEMQFVWHTLKCFIRRVCNTESHDHNR